MDAREYRERTLDTRWRGTLGRTEQEPPDAEETVRASTRFFRTLAASDRENHDLIRDEQALDPYGEGVEGALPPEDLQTVARPTLRAAAPDAPASPSSARELSGATTSDEQQPGRGRAQAA
jgi:hypothetical protein